MVKTAKVLSYIFHPVIMPLLGIVIIFNSGIYETDIPWQYEKYTYLSFGLFSLLLPASLVPIFYYSKLTSDFQINEKNERTIPLAITSFFLIALHVFISRILPVKIILAYTLTIAIISIAQIFINLFYKISLHLTAIGALIALIIGITIIYEVYPFLWLSILVLVAGISSSSRMLLKAHNSLQLIAGFSFGFLITISVLLTKLYY